MTQHLVSKGRFSFSSGCLHATDILCAFYTRQFEAFQTRYSRAGSGVRTGGKDIGPETR